MMIEGATTAGTRTEDEYGRATHLERINPGPNPAYIPGTDGTTHRFVGPQPGEERKPYRLLEKVFDGFRVLQAGERVMLYLHEVAAHHAEITDEGTTMTPEQFNQLMALLKEMLGPVQTLAEKQLAMIAENERQAAEYEAKRMAARAAEDATASAAAQRIGEIVSSSTSSGSAGLDGGYATDVSSGGELEHEQI